MNKKIFTIIFIFFISFVFMNNVSAVSSATINSYIDEYNSYKEKLDSGICDEDDDEDKVNECNTVTMNRNVIVAKLMQYNANGDIPAANKAQVNEIIKENEDICGSILDDEFTNMISAIMKIFYIIGPILLIVFGTLDYSKVVISSDKEALKKANKKFFRRVIATIFLFATPALVSIILSFDVSGYYMSGNSYACQYSYKQYNKQWEVEVKQVELSTGTSLSTGASSGTRQGDYIVFKQSDPQWGGKKLLKSCRNTIASAGCALTSVTMQVVNSGVQTTQTINPGTFNDIILNNMSLGNCDGNMPWEATKYATNEKLTLASNTNITGNISSKANQLASYISQGYYPVIQVKYGTSNSTHYVAVFKVSSNGEITVGDPTPGEVRILNNTDLPIAHDSYASQAILYEMN